MNTTDFMTAEEAARILGTNPQSIRAQAHRDPLALGFPVIVIGRRVLIPRKPFTSFIQGGEENDHS